MSMKLVYSLAFADAVMGAFIFFVCFCRVVVSSRKVLGRVRLKFILLGPAALAFGMSPIWGNLPGYTEPLLMLAICIGLLSETYQWKGGPPDSVQAETMPGPLYANFRTSFLQLIKDKVVTPIKSWFKAQLDELLKRGAK